jgi:hypothetical protein
MGVLKPAGAMRVPLFERSQVSEPDVEVLEQRYKLLSWKNIWTSDTGLTWIVPFADHCCGTVMAARAALEIGADATPM